MKQVTSEKFSALRQEGHEELYVYEIRGLDFIFRPLTYSEFTIGNELEKHVATDVVNEIIDEMAVLYSEMPIREWLDSDNTRPTDPDKLAQVILDASGFNDAEVFLEKLDKARDSANEVNSLVTICICKAFPSISPQSIAKMTLEEQLRYFALSEELNGSKIDMHTLLGSEESNTERPPASPSLPVPEGMETTDTSFLLDENAPGLHIPDLNDINGIK
jgi:hypothetical protein